MKYMVFLMLGFLTIGPAGVFSAEMTKSQCGCKECKCLAQSHCGCYSENGCLCKADGISCCSKENCPHKK